MSAIVGRYVYELMNFYMDSVIIGQDVHQVMKKQAQLVYKVSQWLNFYTNHM